MKHQIQTKTKTFGFDELLQISDSCVWDLIQLHGREARKDKKLLAVEPKELVWKGRIIDMPTLRIRGPQAWLALNGTLAFSGSNDNIIFPCMINLGQAPSEVLVAYDGFFEGEGMRPWCERAYFYGLGDLNYGAIADHFYELTGRVPDAKVAADMLSIMMGLEYDQTLYEDEDRLFLACMVTLMFGLEASRFPSALLFNVLLLDMIMHEQKYGRSGSKTFSFLNAFQRFDRNDNALVWDAKARRRDAQKESTEWYGGKYPYAVHGTGTGNMAMRRKMANVGGKEFRENFYKLPQRHAVPRREVALLVHWVEAMLPQEELESLTHESLTQMVMNRLKTAYVKSKAALPERFKSAPRRDTGLHAARVNVKDIDGTVFWYQSGVHYHIDIHCKLLPKYEVDRYGELFLGETLSKMTKQVLQEKGLLLSDGNLLHATDLAKVEEKTLNEKLTPPVSSSKTRLPPRLDVDRVKREVKNFKSAFDQVHKRGVLITGSESMANGASKKRCPVCVPLDFKQIAEANRLKKPKVVSSPPSKSGESEEKVSVLRVDAVAFQNTTEISTEK